MTMMRQIICSIATLNPISDPKPYEADPFLNRTRVSLRMATFTHAPRSILVYTHPEPM